MSATGTIMSDASTSTPAQPPLHPTVLPFHSIPGVANFRDIGGWPITSTSHVRTNLIFRGSDTTRITPLGIHALTALNITTDFDLRNKSQVEKLGYKDLSEYGISRIWSPVFGDSETDEEVKQRYELYASEDVADIVQAFVEILTSGAPMIATVLRHLLSSNSPQALFMHCTTGNNRTGVFIALLLLLLNVPPQYVIEDYTLSEIGLAPTRHVNVERLLKKGAFSEFGIVEARRKCERMVSARRESMECLLEEVARRWKGAEGYFLEVVRLSAEEVQAIKHILTADGEGNLSIQFTK